MTTKTTFSFILNVFRGEDNEMELQTTPLNEFQWLPYFMDNQTYTNALELSDVLKDAEEWFNDEVQGHTEEDAVVLKQHYDNFVKQLKEYVEDEDAGVMMIAGGWGVEYDNNFGVLIHMFEPIEFEVEEEQEE